MTVESSDDESTTVLARAPFSLTAMMRDGTRLIHARAERSGVVKDILRGGASRYAYALFLRNLLPAYQQLEAGLEYPRHTLPVKAAARRELYRAAALSSDLFQLFGADWQHVLPLLAAGERYSQRIAEAARGDGAGLIAHAYTRYLGDLSGGQVMKRLLARALGLGPAELSFYNFPGIDNINQFKELYRRGLDESAALILDISAVVAEATAAFELNVAVSQAVQHASTAPA
jgi:heme oxygenase (biliverdin-producing, ferredoxin)